MKPVYTLDCETDPFEVGRIPEVFSIGLFDGKTFVYFWGSDCIYRMFMYLQTIPPGIIYAHNGGRFDIFFFMDWVLNQPMRIINSRIIRAEMKCGHEIRDSYAIMPFALGKFKGKKNKLEIEIWKLEKGARSKYRREILKYLERDCVLLWELCSAFTEKFGPQLTIGSTAMKELKKLHSFTNLDSTDDKEFRSKFYYGGRVQCFQKGILPGKWKVYDINSSYPTQ